jgi:hypothetical protein
MAGANVGRAVQPVPANCDGAKVVGLTVTPDVPCTYPTGTFGELGGNIVGLLATQKGNTTPLSIEADTAPEFYVNGNPTSTSATVRKLEHDVSGLTANNPYTGNSPQPITNYLADPTEEAILHMVNADPARTPTFALFAKPDYYLFNGGPKCNGPCVGVNSGFGWNHGAYAPEINTNWVGFAGPGVAPGGLDGSNAANGVNSAGPGSGQGTVPTDGVKGTWADETDIRPTLMFLAGLTDDYTHDGRVITQILDEPHGQMNSPQVGALGACYKQLNSSVGQFGTSTLKADTAGIESTSAGDGTYANLVARLSQLEKQRDSLAGQVKKELNALEFGGTPIRDAHGQIQACQGLIDKAASL